MSSETLGPMVDVTYADRKKAPFKASGRSLIIALDKAARLSTSFGASKLTLPTEQWMIAVRSVRYSVLPPLAS
jgi:hypothetical protein